MFSLIVYIFHHRKWSPKLSILSLIWVLDLQPTYLVAHILKRDNLNESCLNLQWTLSDTTNLLSFSLISARVLLFYKTYCNSSLWRYSFSFKDLYQIPCEKWFLLTKFWLDLIAFYILTMAQAWKVPIQTVAFKRSCFMVVIKEIEHDQNMDLSSSEQGWLDYLISWQTSPYNFVKGVNIQYNQLKSKNKKDLFPNLIMIITFMFAMRNIVNER